MVQWEKNPILNIFLTCSNIGRVWANLFLWDFVTFSWLKEGKKYLGSIFMFVILFVCWNLPLNFLFPCNEIKHPGKISPSLIMFPLKQSQVQFIISKTTYWISTLPHIVLVDKGRKWHGSLLSRSSVANVETNAYLYFNVMNSLILLCISGQESSGDGHLDWGGKTFKEMYPEGGYLLMYQKI